MCICYVLSNSQYAAAAAGWHHQLLFTPSTRHQQKREMTQNNEHTKVFFCVPPTTRVFMRKPPPFHTICVCVCFVIITHIMMIASKKHWTTRVDIITRCAVAPWDEITFRKKSARIVSLDPNQTTPIHHHHHQPISPANEQAKHQWRMWVVWWNDDWEGTKKKWNNKKLSWIYRWFISRRLWIQYQHEGDCKMR